MKAMNNNKKPKTIHDLADLAVITGTHSLNEITDIQTLEKKIIMKESQQNMTQNITSAEKLPNIGWMYYKDYFKKIDFDYITKTDKKIVTDAKEANAKYIKEKNRKIIEETKWFQIEDGLGIPDQSIKQKISYPGLITGVGITHEAGVEGEFKLGLHFDFTYGQPIIHGSSVKGLLRSVFPNFKEGKDKHAESKLEFLRNFLNSKFPKGVKEKAIKQIEEEIFEGKKGDGTRIDIYHRDIFYDAIIISPDGKERVVASDAITPHGKNPLQNPIPLPFLKISPGCTIQFRFDLKDGKFLLAQHKKELFEEIIKTLGVGAKTNVGYGQFD